MKQLFSAIPSVLSGLGPNAEIDEAVVFAAWARCAGDPLRLRTAPLEFFENRLVVAVQDETWQRHLEDLSPRMLARLNGMLSQGAVRFIEFRIDLLAVNAVRQSIEAVKKADNGRGDLAPSLVNAAEAIVNQDLREQFLSAAAGYLEKQGRFEKG